MPQTVHHELIVTWDTMTEDPSREVLPDNTVADTWRKIVEQHLRLGPDAATLQVTAKSWVD